MPSPLWSAETSSLGASQFHIPPAPSELQAGDDRLMMEVRALRKTQLLILEKVDEVLAGQRYAAVAANEGQQQGSLRSSGHQLPSGTISPQIMASEGSDAGEMQGYATLRRARSKLMSETSDERESPALAMGLRRQRSRLASCKKVPVLPCALELNMDESEQPSQTQSRSRSKQQTFVAQTLPLGWPSVLQRRWHEEGEAGRTSVASMRDKGSQLAHSISTEVTLLNDKTRWQRCFVIDPNSRFHIMYSFTCLLLLIYDLTMLPYVLAWDVEVRGFLYISFWTTPTFWTFDICMNFITGSYRKGEVIRDLRVIRNNYFRSWFWPDLATVLCDWVSLSITASAENTAGGSLKLLRFTKLGRLVRIVGMVRILRVVRLLEEFADRHFSEGMKLTFQMFNLFAGILWGAHLLACLWFAVGTAGQSDTGLHWTDAIALNVVRDGVVVSLRQAEPFYQYMVSFHWAASQIALGGSDSMASNSLERWVYICAMMFGFLFGSTLVSTLSAAMMDYQMMHKETKDKVGRLRQYLRENKVDPKLAMHVQRQVEERLSERDLLAETEVETLQLLALSLRSQLRFEIQRPCLTSNAVFRLWTSLDIKWMQRTCLNVVSFVHLRPKDELFHAGTTALVAHALVSGDMSYTQDPESAPVQCEDTTQVAPESWLCEAALWVKWVRVGKAEARTACSLLEVDAEKLFAHTATDLAIREIAVEYCAQFHRRVTAACPPHAPWPTDLYVPFTDYCDLVVSMSPEVQVVIGRDALSHIMEKGGRSAKAVENLTQEVNSSKSIVVVLGTGAIIRVVSLVVLRAVDEEGRVFVEVGKWDGKKNKAACQLPALKQDQDELISETLERMFKKKLSFLEDKLTFSGFTRENLERMSNEYGVMSRYMRSICAATVTQGCFVDAPICRRRIVKEPSLVSNDVSDAQCLDAAACRLLTSVESEQVFCIPAGGNSFTLYAWLPQDVITALGTPCGEKVLAAWMSRFAMPGEGEGEGDEGDAGDGGDQCDSESVPRLDGRGGRLPRLGA